MPPQIASGPERSGHGKARVGKGLAKRGQKATRDEDGFLPSELEFIGHYMTNGFKGSDAARAMNPQCKFPGQTAQNFLRRAHVLDEVRRRQAELQQRSRLTVDRIVQELEDVTVSNIDDFTTWWNGRRIVDWSKLEAMPVEEQRRKMAAISSMECEPFEAVDGSVHTVVKKFRLWDKRAAAKDLLEYHGVIKGNGSGGTTVNVQVNNVTATDPVEAARRYQRVIEGAKE